MVFLGGQFKSEMGGQFESATHGQFKSAQGGQFDRILHLQRLLRILPKLHSGTGQREICPV